MNHNGVAKSISAIIMSVLIFVAISILSCEGDEGSEGKVGVVVTLLPQAEFVERIGGDKVDIEVMVPSGADPHIHAPTPSQMDALSRADMYAKVGSGVEFEVAHMDDLIEQNKDILVVDCSHGVSLIDITGEHEEEEGDHEDSGMDPHIWMSPVNARIMVENICEGLVQIDPDNRDFYEQNRDTYLEELTQLDQGISDGLAEVTNRRFLVYHPAFGYFAGEYDLEMISVQEEGKAETLQSIENVIEQAEEHNIKVIFTSPQFNQDSAGVIADEIGGEVVSVDPLDRDYLENMRFISDKMIQAME